MARLLGTAPVFLVGNIEGMIRWYESIGFAADYFPPGFAILRRDAIQIFLQRQEGYERPEDHGRAERSAWDLYIHTDDIQALFEELSRLPEVRIAHGILHREYGQIEFAVVDPNGYVLVFAEAAGS